MDRILVEIYIPSINETKDVFISSEMKFYFLCDVLKEYLETLVSYDLAKDMQVNLCTLPDGMILPPDSTPARENILNGTRLMFY